MNRFALRLALALTASAAAPCAFAAAADNTAANYTPTTGGYGSVAGAVLQQSSDGKTSSPVNNAYPLPTAQLATGAPITASATGASGKTTYINGFAVSCLGPAVTAVSTTITVSGLVSGSQTYQLTQAVNQTTQVVRNFAQPVPASAANTAIVVQVNAVASGTTCSVNAEGFRL